MDKIRLGVIGCGDIARSMLLVFKITRGVSVVALCDTNRERLEKAGKRFKKAELFLDFNELIEKSDCDSIYIALPHYLHYPVMKKALAHGMHILCEKPITIKEDNAEEIVRLAGERNLGIAVNYQYRYDPHCYRLVRAVKNGDLGKIYFIRCAVPWSRDDSYFDMAPWHMSREKSGGGTLITQGSHLLDIILWMTGSGISSADGICTNLKFTGSGTEDFCMTNIELECGIPVQFMSTMVSPVERKVRLEVYGEKGFGEYTKGIRSRVVFRGVRPPQYRYKRPAVHPVQKGLRDFRDSITKDAGHLCPGEEAVKVLKAVNFIYKNSKGVYHEGLSEKKG